MADLLPYNASPLESALSESIARISDVPVPTRDVWSPDNCPSGLLPWLAWAFSVDEWDVTWTDEQKRSAIKSSVAVHRYKGTIGSVRNALSALGYSIQVQEWFNQSPAGVPYTYRLLLNVDQVGIDQPALNRIMAVVDATKNLRSHMDVAVPTVATVAQPSVAAVAHSGNEIGFNQVAGNLFLDGTWRLDGTQRLNSIKF